MKEVRLDEELVTAVLEGEDSAFEEIVGRYRDAVFAVGLSRLGNFHDAEDVAQEVFVEAYCRTGSLRSRARLGAWLRAITIHRAIDALRRRQCTRDIEDMDAVEGAVAGWRSRERTSDLQHEVMVLVARLSKPQRETTMLFYIDGYSVDEVAAIQEVPAGTVKRRLHDARKRLKEEMVGMVESVLKSGAPKDDFADRVFEVLCQHRPGHANPYAHQRWHETVVQLRKIGGKGVAGFIQALESPHSPTRVFAAHMLQRHTAAQGDEALWETLKKALADANRKVRRLAVEALMFGGLPDERKRREIAPLVIPLLTDPSKRVRRDAAHTLADYASEVPVEAAVKALAGRDRLRGAKAPQEAPACHRLRWRNKVVPALLKTVCHGGSCPAVPAHLPRIREKARPFGHDESRPYNFSTEQVVP